MRVVPRAVVRGNRIVLDDHLTTPALRDGVRYVRSIDLLLLSKVAATHRDVPEMFDAYNRGAPPAALPDFLGALSTMIALDMLVLS